MADETLRIILQVQNEASRPLQQVQRDAKETAEETESAFEALKGAGAAVATVFAAAATAAATALFAAKQFADTLIATAAAVDQLVDLAPKLQITAETLSVLSVQAKLAGSDINAMGGAIRTFSEQVARAQSGNKEAVALFERIGISVADLRRMNVEQAFFAASDALRGFREDAAKASTGADLFGRSYQELVPVINGGTAAFADARVEAERLGVVIGDDLANKAGTLGDANDKLAFAYDGLKRALLDLFGPSLTSGIDSATASLVSFRGQIEGLGGDLRQLNPAVYDLAGALNRATGEGTVFAAQVGVSMVRVAQGAAQTVPAINAAVTAVEAYNAAARSEAEHTTSALHQEQQAIAAMRKEAAAARAEMAKPSLGPSAPEGGFPDLVTPARAQFASLREFVTSASREIAAIPGRIGTAASDAVANAARKGAESASAAIRAYNEEMRRAGLMETESGINQLMQEELAAADQLRQAGMLSEADYQAFRVNKAQEAADQIAAINQQQVQQQESMLGSLKEGFARFVSDNGNIFRQMSTLANSAAESISSNLGNALGDIVLRTKSWQQAMQDAGRAIIAELVRIIARMLVALAIASLLSLIPGGAAVGKAADVAVGSGGGLFDGQGSFASIRTPSPASLGVGSRSVNAATAQQSSAPAANAPVTNIIIQATDAQSFARLMASPEGAAVIKTVSTRALAKSPSMRSASQRAAAGV